MYLTDVKAEMVPPLNSFVSVDQQHPFYEKVSML